MKKHTNGLVYSFLGLQVLFGVQKIEEREKGLDPRRKGEAREERWGESGQRNFLHYLGCSISTRQMTLRKPFFSLHSIGRTERGVENEKGANLREEKATGVCVVKPHCASCLRRQVREQAAQERGKN